MIAAAQAAEVHATLAAMAAEAQAAEAIAASDAIRSAVAAASSSADHRGLVEEAAAARPSRP